MPKNQRGANRSVTPIRRYNRVLGDFVALLESARRVAARSVNSVMTATYWEIGRRIVECEQGGDDRAEYGESLLKRLSRDLTARFGRGFGVDNLQRMRSFYRAWHPEQIYATLSRKSLPMEILQAPSKKSANAKRPTNSKAAKIANVKYATLSRIFNLEELARVFPLPWSHYVLLLKVDNPDARQFYEAEALRSGWTVRQLDRQITTLFYERTLRSRKKEVMLKKGEVAKPEEKLTPEDEIKDPFVLEFLGLKDEYSESDLEDALIRELETVLMELGGDFTFVGRQRRLLIGGEWYRIDLLFFHRRLRCLIVIDLKLGKLTHADAGQMHLYRNYAREHWTNTGENPPVGLILCTQKDAAIAHYALEGLPNKVMAAEYRTTLLTKRSWRAKSKPNGGRWSREAVANKLRRWKLSKAESHQIKQVTLFRIQQPDDGEPKK